MLRSMTGFGRSVTEDNEGVQTWEIRSVNNRFLDLKWRLPFALRGLEQRFERVVRTFARRGRLEIELKLQQTEEKQLLHFNEARACAMLDALQHLAEERGEYFTTTYTELLHVPQLWTAVDEDDAVDELYERLEEGLIAALEDWNESRNIEGESLTRDIKARVLQLEEWVSIIEERAPSIKRDRIALVRERLAFSLSQLQKNLGTEINELDETRFLQEIVILSDKIDVTEELTRLKAHFERLNSLLDSGNDMGRKLDFTLQECFREITTCGNKVQDAHISCTVVDCKNELEKCREQVQNVE